MGGRLCFDVGELDKWQIIPFFKGIAKSGKSTLITKVFKKFYESQDVGTLSNNIEKKFGLSAIANNFMFIAPEVKGDLSLEQAEFQSIVSGEDVSIAVKNKHAIPMVWKVPGVLEVTKFQGGRITLVLFYVVFCLGTLANRCVKRIPPSTTSSKTSCPSFYSSVYEAISSIGTGTPMRTSGMWFQSTLNSSRCKSRRLRTLSFTSSSLPM